MKIRSSVPHRSHFFDAYMYKYNATQIETSNRFEQQIFLWAVNDSVLKSESGFIVVGFFRMVYATDLHCNKYFSNCYYRVCVCSSDYILFFSITLKWSNICIKCYAKTNYIFSHAIFCVDITYQALFSQLQ